MNLQQRLEALEAAKAEAVARMPKDAVERARLFNALMQDRQPKYDKARARITELLAKAAERRAAHDLL